MLVLQTIRPAPHLPPLVELYRRNPVEKHRYDHQIARAEPARVSVLLTFLLPPLHTATPNALVPLVHMTLRLGFVELTVRISVVFDGRGHAILFLLLARLLALSSMLFAAVLICRAHVAAHLPTHLFHGN